MSRLSIAQFLEDLRQRDIRLWREGDSLRFSAPAGALTDDLRTELIARKAEIVACLATPAQELIPIADRATPLPLSIQQERLCIHDRIEPGLSVYNVPLYWRLRGSLDARILARSLDEIARRHEVLRTTFTAAADSQVVQVIHPFDPRELPVLDCKGKTAEEREAKLAQLISEQTDRPFDLARGPLWRATLVRLAADDHALLLTWHHIVFDGWSGGIFARELEALYRAFLRGEPNPLAEPPIQYADFARWQRQSFDSARIQKQLDSWRARLSDGAPPLALPLDRPRLSRPSHRGAVRSRELPGALQDGLREIARTAGATMFMTILATFKALLARYTGDCDISIGTPIAQRPRVETEKLIGFFLNMLVLRSDLSGDPNFRELLRRERGTVLEAFENQEVPFEKLVEELRPVRPPNCHPFFQVAFVIQPEDSALALRGVAVEPIAAPCTTAKFDLTLSIEELKSGLRATFEYSTDLFDEATIDRMLGSFEALVASIIASPDAPLSRLPLLDPAERQRLLVEWNRTDSAFPSDKTVHALFEEKAAQRPDAIAIEFGDLRVSYGELNARANQIAQHLRILGAEPGVLIGVCVERSAEMVAAVLGILKTGAAYVPLDPALPAARLALMIEDAAMPLIVTQGALASALPPHLATLVCLDDAALAPATAPAPQPVAGTPDDLAYVIFTSGSTGRPKGVEITHRALTNFLRSMQRSPGMNADDVLLAVTTLSFDIAGLEIFLPLICGARLVVVPRETAIDGRALLGELTRTRATLLQATPATWRLLLETPWTGTPGLKALIGGEACPRELAAQLFPKCGELWNMYGPTETTIWSTIQKLTADDAITIGRPIANTQIYLLDANLQPVPVGVPGELHIGGAGLARGYLKRPELTAEKFIPDPFSKIPNARIYKTGDLARYLPDGRIECLGRCDQQIKLRGFRIELGEIESALASFDGIKDSVVVARVTAAGETRLAAYFVAADGASPDPDQLRDHLRARLPDYMLPSAYVRLDRMPLTPSGKIDRNALPAPKLDDGIIKETFVAPRTELERTLCSIWQEVLKIDRAGVQDNFFELGGDSLLGLRIVNRLRELTGIDLSLVVIFEAPTIAALADLIEKNHAEPVAKITPPQPAQPIQRVAREKRRVPSSTL